MSHLLINNDALSVLVLSLRCSWLIRLNVDFLNHMQGILSWLLLLLSRLLLAHLFLVKASHDLNVAHCDQNLANVEWNLAPVRFHKERNVRELDQDVDGETYPHDEHENDGACD